MSHLVCFQVFIPELGMHFKVKNSSRLFACQNPLHQGGGRKGLPKSFINRFTQVYIDKLSQSDLLHICSQLFPEFDEGLLKRMIAFTFKVDSLLCMMYTVILSFYVIIDRMYFSIVLYVFFTW